MSADARDPLAAWQSRIDGAELPRKIEEGVSCCYAVADKIWVADPEGHRWEVWVRHAEAESMGSKPGSAQSGVGAADC